LRKNEVTLARFTPDLDREHRFEEGLVLLTSQRVLDRSGDKERPVWKAIEISSDLQLRHRELSGIRILELCDGAKLLTGWHFTPSQAPSAATFEEAFEALRNDPLTLPNPTFRPDEPGLTYPSTGLGAVFQSPLFRLLKFAKPHYQAILLGLALAFAATGVGLIPPYLTMPLVDDVLVPGQMANHAALRPHAGARSFIQRTADVATRHFPAVPLVAVYLGGLGMAAVLAWLLAWAQGFVLARVSERIAADLRNRTYAHLQRLSLEYFGDKRTGDLIARIGNDTDHLCSFLSDTLVDFITDVLMIVGSAVVLLSLDPWLALATLASFPLIGSLILRVRGRLTHGFVRTGRAWSAMTNVLADTIPGVRVVKAFAQEEREIERFAQANQRIFDINDRINALWTFFWPLVGLLNQIGLLIVWSVGAWEVFNHRVTVGVLTAFIAYIGRFYARLENMSRMLTATQRASASSKRLFEILDRVSTVAQPEHPKPMPEVRGELRFEDVRFRYGHRIVLDRVSFSVSAGEMVGIVGHTGSGKSTVANLACRFYDVSEGAILLDGIDLRELSIEQYRKNIGIVLQDPFLFYGSIADNIAYGQPAAPRQKIIEAARVARAHEFILRLSDAYDSLVGERGQSLSGGERQRVAIARAVLIDPKILILDEATSSVDVQTEREIQQALDNVVKGRTTVAIAHRLSTLQKADKLIVLSQGKLVEEGTHAELLLKGGHYARLYQAQMQGSGEPNGAALTAEERTIEEPTDTSAVPPEEAPATLDEFQFTIAGRDRLCLSRDGKTHKVHPVRCFPLTCPGRWLALVDNAGREFAFFESLDILPAPQRQMVEQVLRIREFLPFIERIDKIIAQPTFSIWYVHTDRGPTHFTLGQDDHVRRLGDAQFVITDSAGLRYMVKDVTRLDSKSRSFLSRYY
jgi:ATP-binding cassette subfamily B protein